MQGFDKNGQRRHFATLMNSQMSTWLVSTDQKLVLTERLRELRAASHQDLRRQLLDTPLRSLQMQLNYLDQLRCLGHQFSICSVEFQLKVVSVQHFMIKARQDVVSLKITQIKMKLCLVIWLFACFQNNQC